MLNPAYKLTIGSKVVDTTDEPQASTAVDLTVALDLDTPADSFTLVLGNVGGLRPRRDDDAIIELGYADNGGLTRVITGKIASVASDVTTTRVVGFNGVDLLLRKFLEKSCESKSAGEIVRDLAAQAGIDVAAAEDGIRFPTYVIDGRRNFHCHMRDLAALCGFDVYVNHRGGLVFEKFVNGKLVHVLEYGKHIIQIDVLRRPTLSSRVEAWGESPTGSNGDDAAAWLTRDFSGSRGQTGSGALFLLERSALRTRDAARIAAQAALTEIKRRGLTGRVVTIGRPEIKLGDAIRLRQMPDQDLNGNYQVRAVTHRITKLGGFTTTVGFRAIATDGL